jgi:GAF domain-containing protein
MNSRISPRFVIENESPLVLTLGLRQPLEVAGFHITPAESARNVLQRVANKDVAVLVLGSELTSPQALEILTGLSSSPTATIVLSAGPEPELFQNFIDDGSIFYLATGDIEADHLAQLIHGAANRQAIKHRSPVRLLDENTPQSDRLLDLCVRLPMQTEITSAGGLLIKTLYDLLDASYAQCLLYDAQEDTLTPAEAYDTKDITHSAASGLTAFVARTGIGISLANSGADPRYDHELDNPGGIEDACILAEPILGPDGVPIAVLAAIRSSKLKPFSADDAQLIKFAAECAAPTLSQILLQRRVQAQLTGRAARADNNSEIFRQEALDYHIRSWDRQGDVVKSLPTWLRTSYWIVLTMVLVGLVGLALLIPGLRGIFMKAN